MLGQRKCVEFDGLGLRELRLPVFAYSPDIMRKKRLALSALRLPCLSKVTKDFSLGKERLEVIIPSLEFSFRRQATR